jgi:hypothetical protein
MDQEQHIEPALAAFTEEERQEDLSVITEDVVEAARSTLVIGAT